MNSLIFRTAWGLAALTSVLVALVSYRYLAGVGLAPNVMANLFARPWILVHAAGASTALLVGAFQFLPGLRGRWPALHRALGGVYVAGCAAGGVSGLMLALGTSSGPVAGWGFGLLALAWLTATGLAWRRAVARRIAEHRRWMVRSFALTFAAVTLRLYMPLAAVAGFDGVGAYVVIAWLCWVPNLLLAELYLRRYGGFRPLLTHPVSSPG